MNGAFPQKSTIVEAQSERVGDAFPVVECAHFSFVSIYDTKNDETGEEYENQESEHDLLPSVSITLVLNLLKWITPRKTSSSPCSKSQAG
jgi:hypothetical protein